MWHLISASFVGFFARTSIACVMRPLRGVDSRGPSGGEAQRPVEMAGCLMQIHAGHTATTWRIAPKASLKVHIREVPCIPAHSAGPYNRAGLSLLRVCSQESQSRPGCLLGHGRQGLRRGDMVHGPQRSIECCTAWEAPLLHLMHLWCAARTPLIPLVTLPSTLSPILSLALYP